MSVRKNQRNDSKIEYIKRFQELYQHTVNKASNLPKRRFADLGAPLIEAMNDAQEMVMLLFLNRQNKSITDEQRKQMVDDTISALLKPRSKFLAFFNIQRIPFRKQCYWAELLNKTIEYIGIVAGYNMENEIFLPVIDYNASKNAKFVNNMRELHKEIYSKVISAPRKVHNSNGKLLIRYADKALYHIIEGNQRIPQTAAQYQKRKKHFEDAMICLKSMNSALVALFNLENLSEGHIVSLSQMYYDEINMLNGVMTSDTKLYGNLE